jgi:hypothetical protein
VREATKLRRASPELITVSTMALGNNVSPSMARSMATGRKAHRPRPERSFVNGWPAPQVGMGLRPIDNPRVVPSKERQPGIIDTQPPDIRSPKEPHACEDRRYLGGAAYRGGGARPGRSQP